MRRVLVVLFICCPLPAPAQKPVVVRTPSGQLVLHAGQTAAFRAAPSAAPRTALRMASVDSKGALRIAALAFAPDGGGLRYDPVTDDFRGTLEVWLEDQEHAGLGYPLPEPVNINLFSEADSLSQGLVRFTGTEQPVRLSIVVRSPADSVKIQFWPLARIDSVTAAVRVLPALRVRVTPSRVAAWGLETAVATAELLGDAHGEFGVTVRPTRADPVTLQFTHREARSAVLRSRGMGPDTVRVSGAGIAPALAVVTYGFPVALMIALTLGSAVGTAALQLGAKTKATRPWWAFVRGLLLGIVAVAAYAVGVKAVPVPIPAQVGEGGAFVVSALAAYLGLRRR
ncbi:MAG TPA: hypothetical protein VNX15_02400 [Gemmatimonadales bacterium]|jgi:hypothetical protein|nr:hypothetical protein [Gemmatimonadales bacterium]